MPTEPQKECKDFALVIPLTKGLHAIIDLEDYALVSKFKWRVNKSKTTFYAYTDRPSGPALKMHRLIAGVANDEQEVDHRNGDGWDNRRSNLRIATRSQNNANRAGPRRGGTPYKGVSLVVRTPANRRPVWLALIQVNKRRIYVGSYKTPEEAARAYDAKARELLGEFACVNFPREGERQA